jgi:hypothetical protein
MFENVNYSNRPTATFVILPILLLTLLRTINRNVATLTSHQACPHWGLGQFTRPTHVSSILRLSDKVRAYDLLHALNRKQRGKKTTCDEWRKRFPSSNASEFSNPFPGSASTGVLLDTIRQSAVQFSVAI